MTTPCNCDDSKAWQARAIRAEADLALVKNLLRETVERIDGLMAVLAPDEVGIAPVFSTEQAVGLLGDDADESEELIAGTVGETVLASGTSRPTLLVGKGDD